MGIVTLAIYSIFDSVLELMTLLLLVHSLMAVVSHWEETLVVYDSLDVNEMKRMLSFHSFLT